MKPRFFLVALSTLSLVACSDGQADSKNQEAVDALIKKTKDELVHVESGTFQMGDFGPIDPKSGGLPYSVYDDNKKLHKVTLDSFDVSKHQVSYADYDTYTQAVGKKKINKDGTSAKYRAPNVPAGVDWYQANDYCQWLAEKSEEPFSLPTEAQWEYAARSRGEFLPYATNDGTLRPGVNYPTVKERESATPSGDHFSPYYVGKYPPNPLGIYQMGLNGFEWVSDWYSRDYYAESPGRNPQGPKTGEEKVRRGGALGESDSALLTVNRRPADPGLKLENNPYLSKGPVSTNTFRCVLNPIRN